MSMWDEYVADALFAMDFPHGVNNDEWTTMEGKTLKVKDMSTQHIINCMKMIGENDDFYHVFLEEIVRRGAHLNPEYKFD